MNVLLTRFDCSPRVKDKPIEDIVLEDFVSERKLIELANVVIFMDEQSGRTKTLKNRWASIPQHIDTLECPGFETLIDLEENIMDTLNKSSVPNEYTGTIRVTLEYIK